MRKCDEEDRLPRTYNPLPKISLECKQQGTQ